MATVAQERAGAISATGSGKRRFNWTPYLFILPHLIFFAVFIGWPFFYGLIISFQSYDIARPAQQRFIGLDNYAEMFNPDSIRFNYFWNALINTFEFVIYSVPVLIIIPLALAVLLNTRVPGVNVFRGIYFAPWVLSVSVIGILFWWIFQSQGGLVTHYLQALGVDSPPRWLSSLPWAWISIVVATVWWTAGFNMIILLAALQDIPDQLYEAASIDGATGWQAFWQVTLPMLRPVLLFVLIITVIASFNLFGQPFFMTDGGPPQAGGGGGTEPVMYRIYLEGFTGIADQGRASAMAFLVAIVMVVVSYLNFRLFRERETVTQ
ncbi:MAG TPA: sugar ABC transporter permease [Chloroflexia bacterium]|nr:sugar ABC transporter permease [Chloroflexia bacterium]